VAPYVGVSPIVGNSTGACMLCSGTDCSAVARSLPRTCRCTDKVCNERHTACILITTPYSSQVCTVTHTPLTNKATEISHAGETNKTYLSKFSGQTLRFVFWHWLHSPLLSFYIRHPFLLWHEYLGFKNAARHKHLRTVTFLSVSYMFRLQ
jgi:hypothetical protein